jgi:DNA-binding MarR family transcriptional regulator
MAGRLRTEIEQKPPFASLEQEAMLNLLRTADACLQGLATALKPFGLSHSQYNVLRILRGAGAEGLPCRDIAERMITRDPDVTRLLNRMEARGLVTRSRAPQDRRLVMAHITAEGLRFLEDSEGPVAELIQRLLWPLGEPRLRSLIALLEWVRSRRS